MTRKALLKAVVIVSIFLLSGTGIAADYTADHIMTSGGKKLAEGKVFIKGDMIRQETVTGEGRGNIMILRPDRNEVWMVNPAEKNYMVLPFQKGDEKFRKWTDREQKKAKYLGKEKVSGLKCKKYEVTEKGRKTYFWTSEKFPFPVKVENKDMYMQYKNIKEKRLSKSVFEIPSGYRKTSIPSFPGIKPWSKTPSQGEEQETAGTEKKTGTAIPKMSDVLKEVDKGVNKLMDMFKNK
jgi:hypothetical protein